MSAPSLLLAQVAALDRSLRRASEFLDRFGQAQALQSKLLKGVKGRFENDLRSLRKRCENLYRAAENSAAAQEDWARFAQLQKDALVVTRECLAFLEGASIRAARFDGGICALADSMLYALSAAGDLAWDRFTLLAVGEVFSTVSGIVRLRFTDTQIWNLPVAAHEFGHYVSGLSRFAEFQESAANAKHLDSRYDSHLGELFSDLFATYTIGPCYLLNCVLLRFSLADASEENKTHPSNTQRVWWMLETLAKMDEGAAFPIYRDAAAQVQQIWGGALEAAGQPPLQDSERARLRPWFSDLYDLVDSRIPNAKYSKWFRSQEMLEQLRRDGKLAARDDDSIPEALNAAWLFRLTSPDASAFDLDQIEKNAFEACTMIGGKQA